MEQETKRFLVLESDRLPMRRSPCLVVERTCCKTPLLHLSPTDGPKSTVALTDYASLHDGRGA